MAEVKPLASQTDVAGRRRIWALVLAFVVVATSVGIAVALSRPTDVQAVQVKEPNVWLSRESSNMYGRLNVDIMELNSVQETTPAFPRWIVQDGDTTVLLGGNRYLAVDPAMPVDIDEDTTLETLPATISQVRVVGEYVVLRDEYDQVYGTTVAELARGEMFGPINEQTDGNVTEQLVAVNVSVSGELIAVNNNGVLVTYQIGSQEQPTRTALENVVIPTTSNRLVNLTTFGDHWALSAQASSDEPISLWIDDQFVADDLSSNAQLPRASEATLLYVTTSNGLVSYDPSGAVSPTLVEVENASAAAAMVTDDECVLAVWPSNNALWGSVCGQPATSLAGGESTQIADRIEWRVVANTVVVNNATRGTAWVLKNQEWQFVPSSSSWVPQESTTSDEQEDNQEDTTDPMPPVPATGENAQFGVRPGTMTRIPVLIGATDPNRGDILSIVPGSVKWGGDSKVFGAAQVVDGNTAIVVDATAVTEGEAVLHFEITDGHDSPTHRVAAQAQIRVHSFDQANLAPRMVLPGRSTRPTYSVAPGAALTIDVLRRWVDPDGDALLLTAIQPDQGSVIARPDGRIVYRASNEATSADVTVRYNVVDALGAVTTDFITVQVRADAPLHITPAAVTGVVGKRVNIPVADYVSGATGMIRIGVLSDVAGLTMTERQSPAAIDVQTATPGEYTISYEVIAAGITMQGTVRFTAISQQDAHVTVAPLAVYVTPGDDTQIDPVSAIANPAQAPLAITDVEMLPRNDLDGDDLQGATVDVTAVEGSELRVFAETPTGQVLGSDGEEVPGLLAGTFRYNVAVLRDSGEPEVIPGFGVVYIVPEDSGTAPITGADAVQVRAGATIDVDVLTNDVAPAGTELVLDPRPRVGTDTFDLENTGLAFASGSMMRILAPREPGMIEIPYYVYTRGNPTNTAMGSIYLNVTPPGGQASPDVEALHGQMRRGGQTVIELPRVGGDPDGDEILATQVTQPENAQVELVENGRALRVASTESFPPEPETQAAAHSTSRVEFSVDISDGDHTVTVPVVVAVTNEMPQPVAFNDYRYEPAGQQITVRPLLNDAIPAGRQGRLLEVFELRTVQGEVVPHRVTSISADGQSFTADVAHGSTVYQYTLATGVAHDGTFDPVREIGVIEGTTSARVIVSSSDIAVPPYPRIVDTYVGAADISGDSFNVDVYTNKVVWSGAALTLGLVDQAAGFTSDSRTHIGGPLEQTAQVLPFELRDASQEGGEYPVVSYGFVHVPAAQLLRPELRDPQRIYEVTEGTDTSVKVDLNEAVVPLADRGLEIIGDPKVDGRRAQANARCVVSGSVVTYYPGMGAPERNDGCTIRARWAGQPESEVSMRLAFAVTLLNAPPEFLVRSIPMRVYPRETNRQLDLLPYIEWQRGSQAVDKSRLTIGCDGSPTDDLVVECSGSSLTVVSVKHTAARQQVQIPVWISGPETFDPRVESAVIIQIENGQVSGLLEVPDIQTTIEFTGFDRGVASETINVLDTIQATLDQRYFGWVEGRVLSESLDCGAQSRLPTTCSVVDSSRINIEVAPGSENSPTPSGTATINYRFVDTTTPDRQAHQGMGRIHITYRSVPPRPTMRLERVSSSSVTLAVTPVDSQPAVSDIRISAQGLTPVTKSVSSGQGWRVEIPNLTVNDKFNFTAAVFNGVGWSAESEPVTAWAYEAPSAPTVTWAPVPNDGKGGRVQLWVTANGHNTGGYLVVDESGKEIASTRSAGRNWSPVLSGRSNSGEQIGVVALAAQQDPISAEQDTARKNLTVNGVAAPKIESLKQVSGGRAVQAEVVVGGRGAGYQHGWVLGGGGCSWRNEARTDASLRQTFEAINSNRFHSVKFCARSVASTMRDLPDINPRALDGNFGESVEVNDKVIVVESPSKMDVFQKFKYHVVGDLQSGFNVVLGEATIGNVKFRAVRVPGDPRPGSQLQNRNVKIYLKADDHNFETSVDDPYTIGPASGKAPYIPAGFQDGFPDFSGGCVAPDNSEFTFTRPAFEDIRNQDWRWEYSVVAPNGDTGWWNYTSSGSGGTKSWTPYSDGDSVLAGEYRFTLTVTFQGLLGDINAPHINTFERTVTCEVPEPPDEGGPEDPEDPENPQNPEDPEGGP